MVSIINYAFYLSFLVLIHGATDYGKRDAILTSKDIDLLVEDIITGYISEIIIGVMCVTAFTVVLVGLLCSLFAMAAPLLGCESDGSHVDCRRPEVRLRPFSILIWLKTKGSSLS